MLVLFNVVPMVVYFIVLARLAERLGTTDWGRMFTMAAATLGTFLTTFAVTVNNHTPAAVCVAVALFADGAHLVRRRAPRCGTSCWPVSLPP